MLKDGSHGNMVQIYSSRVIYDVKILPNEMRFVPEMTLPTFIMNVNNVAVFNVYLH